MTHSIGARFRRSGGLLGLLVLVAFAFLMVDSSPLGPAPAHAATIVVDSETDDAIEDDLCTLREAVVNATLDGDNTNGDCEAGAGADTITFAAGIDTVTLQGNMTSISDNDLTIIDGGDDVTVDGAGLYQLLTVTAGGNVRLTGITLTNGFGIDGGAIVSFGSLEIIDSHIDGNEADGNGGGIWMTSSPPNAGVVIRNSTVNGNSAAMNGGGIFVEDGHLEIYDSLVDGNDALDGGGIFISAGQQTGTLDLVRTSVTDNTAFSDGGGILNVSDTVHLIDSTVARNEATDNGGGIASFSNGPLGVLVLERSTVDHNEAGVAGGGIYNFGSDIHITNSTISTNEVTGPGGGGGLFNEETQSSTMTLINATVAFNVSSPLSSNSGIHNSSPATDVVLLNTIVAENDPVDCSGDLVAGADNLDSDGTCNLSSTGDANLGPLQDNGGFTETHALLPGSDAIDEGDNGVCAVDPVDGEDQRGEDRPQDGDGNGSAICDIGAYEAAGIAPTPAPSSTPPATAAPHAVEPRPSGLGSALAGLFNAPAATPTALAPQVSTIRPPNTGDGGLH